MIANHLDISAPCEVVQTQTLMAAGLESRYSRTAVVFHWVLGLAVLGAASVAFADQKLVPAQSEIVFVSKRMGVPVEGRFKKFDAQLAFDPAKPETNATGTFSLKRLTFQIGQNEWADTSMVADDVQVKFKFALTGDGSF